MEMLDNYKKYRSDAVMKRKAEADLLKEPVFEKITHKSPFNLQLQEILFKQKVI